MTIDTKNRNYQLTAKVSIKKPSNVNYEEPSDDVVNWWHIQLKNKHTVFYKIVSCDVAEYNKEFDVELSFLDDEIVKEIVFGNQYDLYRGPEKIGFLVVQSNKKK